MQEKKDQRWKTEGTTFLQFNLSSLKPLANGESIFFQKGKISEVKSCNKRNPYPNCKLVILGYLNSYEKSLNEII